MFSRALMWDSSSCRAKGRAEQSMGWVGPQRPFLPQAGPPSTDT